LPFPFPFSFSRFPIKKPQKSQERQQSEAARSGENRKLMKRGKRTRKNDEELRGWRRRKTGKDED
jgi:hypothetical protein